MLGDGIYAPALLAIGPLNVTGRIGSAVREKGMNVLLARNLDDLPAANPDDLLAGAWPFKSGYRAGLLVEGVGREAAIVQAMRRIGITQVVGLYLFEPIPGADDNIRVDADFKQNLVVDLITAGQAYQPQLL